MIYLLFSIICNTLLYVIIKYYDRYRINTFRAIVFNYFTAGTLGYINSSGAVTLSTVSAKNWLMTAIILGSLFISIFILLARTAQRIGLSTASVANKMSVIIPVIAAVYLYNDALDLLQIAGIALALASVYLASAKEGGTKSDKALLILPIVVFIGSGVIDAIVNYAQKRLLCAEDQSLFISVAFYTAGILGGIVMLTEILKGNRGNEAKNILGGILLGIPNYLSIYFMVKALSTDLFPSSILFPVANMGVVTLSAVGGYFLFRERFSQTNLIGIALALIAIMMIAL